MTFLSGFPIIPLCSPTSPAEAEHLAQALLDGGVPIVEITLRTPDALENLAVMAAVDGLTVGAGTVRTSAQLHQAVEAGATFVVSPCLTDRLAEAARQTAVPFLPGTATATEIQRAVDAGFQTVKFFPAEASGGLPALRALADVFGDVSFVPTGGISGTTAPTYLRHRQVVAVGGSWMLPTSLREAGDWDAVAAEVAACAELASAAT